MLLQDRSRGLLKSCAGVAAWHREKWLRIESGPFETKEASAFPNLHMPDFARRIPIAVVTSEYAPSAWNP